jgi:hypothetical protein
MRCCRIETLPDLLLPPHPHLSISVLRFGRSLLNFPDLELVATTVRFSSMEIERPVMLGAGDTRAQNDAKVFNIKRRAIG